MNQIGVIGSSHCSLETYEIAREVGARIAKNKAILVCGGLTGVMEAACKGAKKNGGVTVGILPSLDKEDANEYVDIAIPTGYGLARNHMVVRCSDVLIAVEGNIGTLSEITFALNENKTVISLNSWDLESEKFNKGNYIVVSSAKEAVNTALKIINSKN